MASEPSADAQDVLDAVEAQVRWHGAHDRDFAPEFVAMIQAGAMAGWSEMHYSSHPDHPQTHPTVIICLAYDLDAPMAYELCPDAPTLLPGHIHGRAMPVQGPKGAALRPWMERM